MPSLSRFCQIVPRAARDGKVGHDDLGGFGLAGAALTADEDRLAARILHNVHVCCSSHREEMGLSRVGGCDFVPELGVVVVGVALQHLVTVELREALEGVDGDEDIADVRVDGVALVAQPQRVEDGGFVQVRQRHGRAGPARAACCAAAR